jgi:hypothetical protein
VDLPGPADEPDRRLGLAPPAGARSAPRRAAGARRQDRHRRGRVAPAPTRPAERSLTTRHLLAALALCVAACSLLVACGDDDGADAGSTTATATADGAALPIEERVVQGDLGGLPPAGPVEVARTPEEFVELVDPDQPAEEAAAFRRGGFVEGAVQLYLVGSMGDFGLSAASQFGSPEQALAEVERLGDDFATDLPPRAVEEPLPGVPGSRTTLVTRTQGDPFSFGSAIFADGPFVYVQLAGGTSETIDPQAVLDAATALYEKVQGSPAP